MAQVPNTGSPVMGVWHEHRAQGPICRRSHTGVGVLPHLPSGSEERALCSCVL